MGIAVLHRRPTLRSPKILSFRCPRSISDSVLRDNPAAPHETVRPSCKLSELVVIALVPPTSPKRRSAILEQFSHHVRQTVVFCAHFNLQLSHRLQVLLDVVRESLCHCSLAFASFIFFDQGVDGRMATKLSLPLRKRRRTPAGKSPSNRSKR